MKRKAKSRKADVADIDKRKKKKKGSELGRKGAETATGHRRQTLGKGANIHIYFNSDASASRSSSSCSPFIFWVGPVSVRFAR